MLSVPSTASSVAAMARSAAGAEMLRQNMEKIKLIRRQAKEKVFVTNAIRAGGDAPVLVTLLPMTRNASKLPAKLCRMGLITS